MRYLIDGHNLIAHLPDISLDDPDDEARLVMQLRSFTARTRHQVTVVFDHGIPGGWSPSLSTSQVTVRFASAEHTSADHLLLNMLNQVKNPGAFTLVSSDGELRAAAQERGIAAMTAPEFAARLRPPNPKKAAFDEKDPHLRLSAQEVAEWLALFQSSDK